LRRWRPPTGDSLPPVIRPEQRFPRR
jgi:hypothetical protein